MKAAQQKALAINPVIAFTCAERLQVTEGNFNAPCSFAAGTFYARLTDVVNTHGWDAAMKTADVRHLLKELSKT